LGVTQKTAWFMLSRIRLAMHAKSFEALSGEVEVDETFIGGRSRNMHKDKRERIARRGTGLNRAKVNVLGMLQRKRHDNHHSTVVLKVVPDIKRRTVTPIIEQHVEEESNVYTDALKS